jgi:DNA-binding MarR family transcriptional regulator
MRVRYGRRMRHDYIDASIEAWETERPGLDVAPVAVIGRIRRAASLIDERIATVITRFGIRNPGDFDTLATLRREGEPFELSPKELASRLLLTSAGLSGRLDRLEAAGWVERSPHPDDRRATIVSLTVDGLALVDEVHRHILDEYRAALGFITDPERDQLADSLRAILVNLGDA